MRSAKKRNRKPDFQGDWGDLCRGQGGKRDEKGPKKNSIFSASPERLFSSVGLVKSDLRGRLLDSTLIDVMWAKQAP
jgi:hypothetical protein